MKKLFALVLALVLALGCASALAEGKIAPSRYRSYERLYEISAQYKDWELPQT